MGNEQGTITVGKLARAVTEASGIRCTPRMIHNYESKCLINPPERSGGGIRLYPEENVSRIVRIKKLQRDYNLSLAAIRRLLEHTGDTVDTDGVAGILSAGGVTRGAPASRAQDASRRDSLINAAETVLRAKGYRATTIEDIVKEAGVAKGTFYLYFEGKQELFLAVLERAVRSLEDHLGQALDGVTGPFDRLERRALSYMRGYLNYRDLIHILYGEAVGGDARLQDEFRSIYAKITSALAVDVEQVAAAPGELDFDPELLSYALVGAGEMLAYRISLDDRYDLETVVRNAFKLIRREPAVKSGGG